MSFKEWENHLTRKIISFMNDIYKDCESATELAELAAEKFDPTDSWTDECYHFLCDMADNFIVGNTNG